MGFKKLFQDFFGGKPCPGYEKEYRQELKTLDVWSYSNGHKRKGLNGHSPKDTIKFYKTIEKCVCGYDKPKVVETVGMGDFDITIICPKCDRYIRRSMYDYDVKEPLSWEYLCVRDWNAGINNEDVESNREKEWERIKLRPEDLKWYPMHPNNMTVNPVDGEDCLVFARRKNGEVYGCKFTILFQREECEPMMEAKDAKTELYILFIKQYHDIKGDRKYPRPKKEIDPFKKTNDTFTDLDLNSYGDFVRAYRTIEEAKTGALARCSTHGLNRDTLDRSDW